MKAEVRLPECVNVFHPGDKGFTLVEFIVVVAILTALSTAALMN
ncbi:MAG: prepilin-type N-terminal cleavage/methylation domain-containing protein [Dehalococcoidia bacterium]|nr:prepilin-type N-terminal cleavage/methylation domain-containing protein [Dehalococcoidia bacterium]